MRIQDQFSTGVLAEGQKALVRTELRLLSRSLSQDVITGKAEQRAALVAMQKGSIDEKCRGRENAAGCVCQHFRDVQVVLQMQYVLL